MTPAQFAKAECANPWPDGSCPFKAAPRCLLVDGKRCSCFEEAVLPFAGMVSEPARSKAYLEAAAEYRFRHHLGGIARRCPDCGGPLPARRRFCADCTAKHRRGSYREYKSRIRGLPVHS